MKVVALISGGKDSCYNMMHCVANGHQIVALANLKPQSKSGKDELDSFLYQTVGHDAIEYYAECINLPLYRREIMGSSLVQDADYQQTSGDETEDLYQLLKQVKEKHPDIQAVSVGAILSNYQRVRVEYICNRLGLTSLAYLWRRNQKDLLNEMINAGINAILIKVAAIGLEPKHLGKSIAQLYPHLCNLNEKYDVHICGEGGEYETFTLDCPLFVKRLVVEKMETVIHSDDAFAAVAYLRLKHLIVEEKQASEIVSNPVIVVPSWKDDIEDLMTSLEQLKLDSSTTNNAVTIIEIDSLNEDSSSDEHLDLFSLHSNPPYYNISGTTAYNHLQEILQFESIEEETQACMLNLQNRLHELDLSWSDVVNMNVFIKDMDEFGRMNAIYKKFFSINPPTRACVGSNLPPPSKIQIDLMAIKLVSDDESSKPRETMHVQSISYWAPANIGPYSQGTIIKSHAFIAGQIGLIPSSLELPQKYETQTFLSLRNLENVTSVLGLNVKQRTALCICFVDDENSFSFAQNAWKIFCRQNNENSENCMGPVLYLSVPSLPRRGKVEWQVLIHDETKFLTNGDEKNPLTEPKIWQDTLDATNSIVIKTITWFLNPILSSVITIKVKEGIPLSKLLNGMICGLNKLFDQFSKSSQMSSSIFWKNIGSIRIFYSEKIGVDLNIHEKVVKLRIKKNFPDMKAAITFIPVLAIMDNSLLGICVHGMH